jgi:3',5'-cyclic AMP phosphodiesterase CpdA
MIENEVGDRNKQILFAWVTDTHNYEEHLNIVKQDDDLQLAVEDCNRWRPMAFIHTGDLGNDRSATVLRCKTLMAETRRPLHIIPGNHDVQEQQAGTPLTGAVADVFGDLPFYYSFVLQSPDATVKARCLMLDCNYYANSPSGTLDSPNHQPGDYIGEQTNSGVSYWRQFGATQLDWIASVLAADSISQFVIVFAHYPPGAGTMMTDYAALCDVLQSDGRVAVAFGGHAHEHAYVRTQKSSDNLYTLTYYKLPALQVSGAYGRVRLSWTGSAVVIDEMSIRNFVNPGGWTIAAPFTLA